MIVDDSITIIKMRAFCVCRYLVSVIMGDNVKRIEDRTFLNCRALRFIRLSKRLEYIGYHSFRGCIVLVALLLPSTVKSIEDVAFENCPSLKLLILPHDIDLNNVGKCIIYSLNAGILSHYAGSTRYEWIENEDGIWNITDESSRRVNEWLNIFLLLRRGSFTGVSFLSRKK